VFCLDDFVSTISISCTRAFYERNVVLHLLNITEDMPFPRRD
jgi:hypothetical protein